MLDLRNTRATGWVLVAANAMPIFGVLFLGWDVHSALVLFWSENLVTGFFAVLRIAFARAGSAYMKIFLIPFFLFHFGMFTAVHGVFVALLVAGPSNGLEDPFGTLWSLLATVWIGVAALVVSHGVSFWRNYLAGGESVSADPQAEMMRPYGRVVTLHVTIIAAAFLLAALGSLNAKPSGFAAQVPALVLIVVKILVDAASHHKAHADRGPSVGAAKPIGGS